MLQFVKFKDTSIAYLELKGDLDEITVFQKGKLLGSLATSIIDENINIIDIPVGEFVPEEEDRKIKFNPEAKEVNLQKYLEELSELEENKGVFYFVGYRDEKTYDCQRVGAIDELWVQGRIDFPQVPVPIYEEKYKLKGRNLDRSFVPVDQMILNKDEFKFLKSFMQTLEDLNEDQKLPMTTTTLEMFRSVYTSELNDWIQSKSVEESYKNRFLDLIANFKFEYPQGLNIIFLRKKKEGVELVN